MRLRNSIIAIALMLIAVGASAQTDLSMNKRHQNIAAVASLTAKGDIDQLKTALATISMYDMGRARRQGVDDTQTHEQRMAILDEIGPNARRNTAGRSAMTSVPCPRRLTRTHPSSPASSSTTTTTPRAVSTLAPLVGIHIRAKGTFHRPQRHPR